MTGSLRIVVTGLIGQYPLGGVAWDYLQYVLGLARLGHDVYYVEDTEQWPYDARHGRSSPDCDFNVRYLGGLLERFGLGDRWAYRVGWPLAWHGLPDGRREEVIASADLLVNVSGSLGRPAAYRHTRRMAYIDSDPVFTQVKLAKGQEHFRRIVDLHDVHFSFGERMGDTDLVPGTGHAWRPTRQPVVLSEWHPDAPRRDVYTTVMNWTSYKPIEHAGRTYGQKDVELRRFLDLPARVAPVRLEVAVGSGKTRRPPRELLAHRGWLVADPCDVCPDLDAYRRYVEGSRAEWSVAKNGYVAGRPGWFSCRSACYLAAGRPVIVQDTGFDGVLPVGRGILTFRDLDEAAEAVRAVERDYDAHAEAALAIARAYFDAGTVLARLLETAMGGQDAPVSREAAS
ncbi:MAG: glycosyltransferase family protein [Planctomycetota bacterium]